MFWLKIIRDFIKILRAGQTPRQIAGGFALGAIVGLSSSLTLQGVFIWFIIFVLDVNLAAALLSFTLFSLFAYLLDPLFHRLGYVLLVDIDVLKGMWTSLYNAPIAPLTRFYNTVILGSFVCALILFVPIYMGMKRFVLMYRSHVEARVEKWKIYKIVHRSLLVRWYTKIRDLGR